MSLIKNKAIACLFLTVSISVSICGCGDDTMDVVVDQIENVTDSEDEHVLMVKGGSPNSYPDKTYEETFENFFGSPTWKYFVGTKEGPDDDGDGEPDYVEENVDIVEFTGNCTYKDVEVKALIQFTLSKEDDTFDTTYLSFNDVPQNTIVLASLIKKAFEYGEVDYYSVYDEIRQNYEELYGEFIDNTLYDMDGDDVKEFIVSYGTCTADWSNDVYQYSDEGAIYIGGFNFLTSLYASEEEGIYAVYERMGNVHAEHIIIEDGEISVNNISRKKLNSIDSPILEEMYIEMTNISDDSLLQ